MDNKWDDTFGFNICHQDDQLLINYDFIMNICVLSYSKFETMSMLYVLRESYTQ